MPTRSFLSGAALSRKPRALHRSAACPGAERTFISARRARAGFNGSPIAVEASAFDLHEGRFFYKIDVVQSDPIKGNSMSHVVARAERCSVRQTITVIRDNCAIFTNKQRFSRRMSFRGLSAANRNRERSRGGGRTMEGAGTQRQRPTRLLATRHRLLSPTTRAKRNAIFDNTICLILIRALRRAGRSGGLLSRRLPDRGLGRAIENAWSHETRSPLGNDAIESGGCTASGLSKCFSASMRDAFSLVSLAHSFAFLRGQSLLRSLPSIAGHSRHRSTATPRNSRARN